MADHLYTDPDGIEWRYPGERRDCELPDCEILVQVGWYCWRCKNVNRTACRSDCVPVHVPLAWARDMEAALLEREEGHG